MTDRPRHPTHGHDHGASGKSGWADWKAKGGGGPNTKSRVNNPKVPGAKPRAPVAAPATRKQVAARPLPKPKAPPGKPSAPAPKAPHVKTPHVKTPHAKAPHPTKAHKGGHVDVGKSMGHIISAVKEGAKAALEASGASNVMGHKKGKE